MESQNFLPKEIIPLSTEYHLSRLGRFPRVIFAVAVISIVVLVGLLPLLIIPVTVKSPGALRAVLAQTNIRAPVDGIVKAVYVRENSIVKVNDLLVEVISPALDEKERYLRDRVEKKRLLIHDLHNLIHSESLRQSMLSSLLTPFYKQSCTDYLTRSAAQETRYLKTQQDYARNKILFDERVIAPVEFENFSYDLERAIADLDLLRQSQRTTWEQELNTLERDVADDLSQLLQTRHETERLTIRAPIAGAIQNLDGIYAGSRLFANQDIARISPDGPLMAVVYVSPSDIGLLYPGMKVYMQINTFNYTQWGLLPGNVTEISNDVRIFNDMPVFEIRCSLGQDHLKLKNGYVGKLTKGMTLYARFVVASRSLWQLLYDKVDNWINPNVRR